ncbi:MAG: hypothetical protein K2K17_10270 [Lachnospiraceae bacterium]|nr:hypothetical protein [Lachnospiraceae bacterium]
MIFKTFQSNLDGISNKIGFSKRSFAEWSKQVSTSFKESEGVVNKFKNTIQTIFTVQSENTNTWIRNNMGDIISKDNIDSLIPELTENGTDKILNQIIAIDKANDSWQDYFKQLESQGQGCIVDLIKNTDDLSKLTGEDLVKANQQSRASALAHNEAIQAQTLSAKAGKVALQALATAGNMIAMWAISKGIEFAVKRIDELAHSAEYCKERVNEVMSSYKSTTLTLNNNAKTISEISDRYDQLSKGVGNLGNNISLTEEEFEEYHNITSKIAEMYPSLVDGWDAQGEAIVNLTDCAKELNAEFEKSSHNANLTLMESKEDIFKNYENTINEINSSIRYAEEALSIIHSGGDFYDVIYDYEGYKTSYYTAFTELGLSIDDMIGGNYDTLENQLILKLNSLKNEMEKAAQDVTPLLNAYLSEDADFQNLSDENLKNVLSLFINNLPSSLVTDINNNGITAGSDFIEGFVDAIKDNEDAKNALMQLSTIDLTDMSIMESKDIIDNYISELVNILSDIGYEIDPIELKTRFGFDDIDQTADNYKNVLRNAAKRISGASDGEIKKKYGNYEEYQAIYDTIDEFANKYSINTQDELAYLQDALEEADYDIDKAFELYLSKMQDDLDVDNFTPTISSSVEQISKQLEPQFAKLGDAYSSIFSDDGFNLDVVDNSMLENLREAFADIEEDLGVTFDANELNGFFDVLTDGTSTANEVRDAFNDLATAYFYSTDTLEHLNEATAESIKQQLEQMGVVNSEEIIDHYLQLSEAENGLLELQEQLAEARKNLIESSNTGEYESAKGRLAFIYKQIEAYYNEKGATEDLRIALFNLQLQQAGLSIDSIDSSSSVSELLSLASAAGLSAEYMDRLVYLQDLFSQYNSATNSNMRSAIYAQIQSVRSSLQKDLDNSQLELKFDFPSGKASGAASAGKDAAEEYLDGFHNELDRLKFLQDNGFITEKEYLDQLRILYVNYFKDREEYLEEYVKYEHEYLNGLKSLYEDVLGGITDLLDDQIDKIEEERDAKMDALEEEQEARTKALELQKEQLDLQIEEIEAQIKGKNDAIDAINDEIDAIKEANDERQRQIDLQKAQYDLERMQNQRTILQYSEDKGMHYANDTSGIRDAKDAVDDAKREIEIADKEKQIALIEDEISLLETRKSLIEDQQADLDKQIDALDEYYKKLIENTEAYYSALIQPIENYKTQFESVAEIESDATFDEQLKSLGYSVDEILALSSSTLENFKSNYLGILSDIYAGNSQMLDSLSMISGLDQDSFAGYLSQSQPYIDSLARLDLSSTQLAIDSANSGIHSFADGAVLATTNMTTMADTVTSLLEGDKKQAGIISSFETMTSVLADANTQIAGIASGMEELDGKTATIRINIETNGDTSLLGMAHVSGTAITGASHVEGTALASGNWAVQSNEKNALVGEIGRELIVRGGRFFTVGNYGAEMFNIKKGDIVFNHEQTEALLKNGHISGRGKAYADGTVGGGRFLTGDGRILRPLQEGDRGFDLLQKFQPLVDRIIKGEEGLITNAVFDSQKQFEQMLKTVMNNTAINNISNSRNSQPVVHQQFNITMPNVTNSTSAETLMNDLQSLSTKKFQMDW